MQEFDPESFSRFDGKEGRPVYIAHQGKVFDVTNSKLWKTGEHMKRHPAGRDLTAEIEAAPHGTEVLERYPQVGVIKKTEEAQRAMPRFLPGLLARYPFLRRHIHPMMVHFPIVFMISPTLFIALYFITGNPSFETTSWYNLGAGILFSLPAIGSGFFTWWLNYLARPMRPVTIKIYLSLILVGVSVLAFAWRMTDPGILVRNTGMSLLYFLLILSLIPTVSAIGWYGATLTFPLEKK